MKTHMLALLVDAEKFYDHIGWDHLLVDGPAKLYPPLQLILAVEMARGAIALVSTRKGRARVANRACQP